MKKYKHKLNMLEPGRIMLICIGVLAVIGLVLQLLGLKIIAWCVLGVAGALIIVLLILLAIEEHQDKVMNESYLKEEEKSWTKKQ
ncbi:MAG: hypothetical protein J5589_12005 [Firmicutes bacterium]|nr:hypothetical protein [Bacillota bacterium]